VEAGKAKHVIFFFTMEVPKIGFGFCIRVEYNYSTNIKIKLGSPVYIFHRVNVTSGFGWQLHGQFWCIVKNTDYLHIVSAPKCGTTLQASCSI
jgi:predicted secreted protein